MNFIVTVKWDESYSKKYLVNAGSRKAAIAEFKRLWGYNPGVPMNAAPAGTFRMDEVEVLEKLAGPQ